MDEKKIIDEQIEYYRARAEEYDASLSGAEEIFEAGKTHLCELGSFNTILELACGTGIWTETLAGMSNHITALDASPEMLEIAHQKLGGEKIKYQTADLFKWNPTETYDLVFFANWLSHVPPAGVDEFLGKVKRALNSGGQIAIVDQHYASDADSAIAHGDIYAKRPLADGREFMIVKAFINLEELQEKLKALGFETKIEKFGENFFILIGALQGRVRNPPLQ